jgi:hypothetical protein
LAMKLSRERRAGKEVPPPPKGQYSERARKRDLVISNSDVSGRGRELMG